MEKILIHSYKGGTGKTTIAANIANMLSHEHKVLLIENDFMMPSFFDIFKCEPSFYFNDYLNGKCTFDDIIVPEVKPNLSVILTNSNFDPNEKVMSSDQEWFYSILNKMINDFKKLDGYDYVIFDSPPGWHLVVVNLIMLATKAIVILRPTDYEVNATKMMLEKLYKRARPIESWSVHLLFNQLPNVDMKTELKKWVNEFVNDGLKNAGFISCSCNLSYIMAHEKLISSEHDFYQELGNVLKGVLN